MIHNLTDTARRYAQARAHARVARNVAQWMECDRQHDEAHKLTTAADSLAARQITAIARAFAKDPYLSCPLAAVLAAELIEQDPAKAPTP